MADARSITIASQKESMERKAARFVFVLLPILALAIGSAARAQTPSPAPASADAAMAAQKAAFLALPEATRKAAQDALVWLGFYNGVADGEFGKRTRDAILAFQASAKAPADGVLSATELQALLAAAQRARDAVGFHVVNDAKTGAKVGAPTKLLAARSGAKLDFASSADPDLSALYARLSAGTPTRNVAYKAMKPDDFFVVSGQEGTAKFYTRFEKSEKANPPIRGFTFTYPASQAAELDRIAIAIANSFEAFPTPAVAPAKTPAASAAPAPEAPASSPVPPAANPEPTATALIVAPGKALTALNAAGCPDRDRRRQARPVRAHGPRDWHGDDRRRLRFEGRSSALRPARAGSHRPQFRWTARGGERRFARGRRGAAGRRRRGGDERRRRTRVRSTRRAGWAHRAYRR